jgi:hypothetical protein
MTEFFSPVVLSAPAPRTGAQQPAKRSKLAAPPCARAPNCKTSAARRISTAKALSRNVMKQLLAGLGRNVRAGPVAQ